MELELIVKTRQEPTIFSAAEYVFNTTNYYQSKWMLAKCSGRILIP